MSAVQALYPTPYTTHSLLSTPFGRAFVSMYNSETLDANRYVAKVPVVQPAPLAPTQLTRAMGSVQPGQPQIYSQVPTAYMAYQPVAPQQMAPPTVVYPAFYPTGVQPYYPSGPYYASAQLAPQQQYVAIEQQQQHIQERLPMAAMPNIAPKGVVGSSFLPHHPSSSGSGATVPPRHKVSAFVSKLYSMLDDPKLSKLIWWSRLDQGDTTIFALLPGFEFADALTLYFKHGNVASFVRQLHMYGFHKVCNPTSEKMSLQLGGPEPRYDPRHVWEFRHSSGKFRRGDEVSLPLIRRRSTSNKAKLAKNAKLDETTQPETVQEQADAAILRQQQQLQQQQSQLPKLQKVEAQPQGADTLPGLPQGFSFHTSRRRYPSVILDPYAPAPTTESAQVTPLASLPTRGLQMPTQRHSVGEVPFRGYMTANQPRSASSPIIRRTDPASLMKSTSNRPSSRADDIFSNHTSISEGIFSNHNSISSVSTEHRSSMGTKLPEIHTTPKTLPSKTALPHTDTPNSALPTSLNISPNDTKPIKRVSLKDLVS